jgi:hypothetical protein
VIKIADELQSYIGQFLVTVSNGGVQKLRLADTNKYINASASGDNIVWTPTAGKKFRILGGMIVCGGTATNVYLKDDDTQISPTFVLVANQILPLDGYFNKSNGILSATADNVLNINLSAANAVAVWICGVEE